MPMWATRPSPKKTEVALLGVVIKLVGDDDVARLVALAHAAAGAEGDDALDAQALEGPDVGPVGHLGGGQPVAATVAGQEGDALAFQGAEDDLVGWIAKGGGDVPLLDVGQGFHLIDAGSANDG